MKKIMKAMTDKNILDACCGGKMFYFDKHDPRVLFQDIRNESFTLCDGRHFEINPDVQADFMNMPYDDETFSMVVFDPPHLLRKTGKSKFADIYGSLNPKAKPTGWQQTKRLARFFHSPTKNRFSDTYPVSEQTPIGFAL